MRLTFGAETAFWVSNMYIHCMYMFVCVLQEHLWVAAFSLSTKVGTIQNLNENAFKIPIQILNLNCDGKQDAELQFQFEYKKVVN